MGKPEEFRGKIHIKVRKIDGTAQYPPDSI
jgi:hypothetical protein